MAPSEALAVLKPDSYQSGPPLDRENDPIGYWIVMILAFVHFGLLACSILMAVGTVVWILFSIVHGWFS